MDANCRNNFLKEAKQGIVTVEFTKLGTGENRVMPCTLNAELIDANAVVKDIDPTSDNFVVWALDKEAWRSFRVSTVTKWYVGKPIEQESKESSNGSD